MDLPWAETLMIPIGASLTVAFAIKCIGPPWTYARDVTVLRIQSQRGKDRESFLLYRKSW
jgi:hypothetical protein